MEIVMNSILMGLLGVFGFFILWGIAGTFMYTTLLTGKIVLTTIFALFGFSPPSL